MIAYWNFLEYMKPLGISKEDFKLEANDQPFFIMNTPIFNLKLLDLLQHCAFLSI